MNINHKLQSLAAVGIMSLSLAVPVVFAQNTATPQSDATTNGPRNGKHWGDKGHGRRGGEFGHRGMGGMFHALDLTDAQKAQAKQIRESHMASMKALHQQIRGKRMEMRQAEQGGTFNEALTTQKLTEIAGIQARLMGEEFQVRQQMLGLLTPEQKAKLEQFRNDRKAKRAERRAPQA
jgi:periplasmic protein CpxP/Spy